MEHIFPKYINFCFSYLSDPRFIYLIIIAQPVYYRYYIIWSHTLPFLVFKIKVASSLWSLKVIWIEYKNWVPILQERLCVFIKKGEWAMLFREVITVYSESINTLCGLNSEFQNVKIHCIYSVQNWVHSLAKVTNISDAGQIPYFWTSDMCMKIKYNLSVVAFPKVECTAS
jgi:hypothetical protein